MESNLTTKKRGRFLCAITFLALYLTSFLFPVFRGEWGGTVGALHVLLTGWLGIFELHVVAWYANPIALVAVICFLCGSFRASFWLALVAVAASLNTFAMFGKQVVVDLNSGHILTVAQLGVGAYLWLASMLFLFTCCGTYAWRERALAKRVA
jgi:hypothetical protein